ncbi:beta-3 adrenergic receptor-like [Pollicipes pollicipes]|uniref:beta-3 adrenergic receptor-like n=1 Tax=Pollicipes pollicipes TaxID=41117 RepID=UPI001884ACCC|nr:beta-3 adrenergic receptor-like [Pollicipes pollicipes]
MVTGVRHLRVDRLTMKDSSDDSTGMTTEDLGVWGVTEPAVAPEPVPLTFILYLLAGLLLSVLIVLTNLLVVSSVVKFYRVQTASNCFLLTLSAADGLIGVVLPVTLLLELSGGSAAGATRLRLLPYCLLVAFSAVSVLTTVAIAVDRCTSLAQPLRYNNLVTRRCVSRFAAFSWAYGLLAGLALLGLHPWADAGGGSHAPVDLLDRTAASVITGVLFLPAAGVFVSCYLYVYCVARTHAKAIQTVEVSYVPRRGVLGRCGLVWWGSVRSGSAAFSTASNIRLCTMTTNHTCIIREVCVTSAACDAVSMYQETVVSTQFGTDNPVTPV